MKLFRFGALGQEKPGLLDSQGQMRDASLLISDWTPEWMAADKLQALHAIDIDRLPLVPEGARIGAPLTGIRQFVAIGLNYRKHALEANMEIPAEPVVFNKAITCISGPNDTVHLPENAAAGDWEIELGIIIGTKAQKVSEGDALSHVAGYVLANDVSERDWQAKRNGQWTKGKSFDGFGPIGPWLVTVDELSDPQSVPLLLSVNGNVRQKEQYSRHDFFSAHHCLVPEPVHDSSAG